LEEKKKAIIAVELTDNCKMKRVYINSLDDYSTKWLTPIFEEHMNTSAKIITDKCRGYELLKENCDIEQIYSINVANFKQLHIIIIQIKYWLRAIPTPVSKCPIQACVDEFCFRVHPSQFKNSIFLKTSTRMVKAKPLYQNQIKQKLIA
jgi:hypothetical protein